MERQIAEFGRRMGLGDLAAPGQGPLALDIAEVGRLYLEPGERELIVYLALPLAPYDERRLPAALGLGGYENRRTYPLACGLAGDNLLLMTRLERNRVTAGELEIVADQLIKLARELPAD